MARRGSSEVLGAETIGDVVKTTMLDVLKSGALQVDLVPRDGKPLKVAEVIRELTPQGVREVALAAAGRTHEVKARTTADYDDAHRFTDEDVLDTARKYETYLRGGFISSELPKAYEAEEELDSGQQDAAQRDYDRENR